jgi:hypothetical protein
MGEVATRIFAHRFGGILEQVSSRCVVTVSPLRGSSKFPLYPGLNHPNPRETGAAWGPRYAPG